MALRNLKGELYQNAIVAVWYEIPCSLSAGDDGAEHRSGRRRKTRGSGEVEN